MAAAGRYVAGLTGPQGQQGYAPAHADELYGDDAHQEQQPSQPQSQSQAEQQQHEGGSEGAGSLAELDDFVTHQLHQLLINDMGTFWASTVAPTTHSIAQSSMVLQQEARHLSSRADGELQGVIAELARVQGLVASFQEQIREALSVLAG